MKTKVFRSLLVAFVLLCTFTVPALAQNVFQGSYPPVLIRHCDAILTVDNLSGDIVPFQYAYDSEYSYQNDYLYPHTSRSFALVPGHSLLVRSGDITVFTPYTNTSCAYGFVTRYDGSLYIPVALVPYVPPVNVYSPETCESGSYQGTLYLNPGQQPLGGTFNVYGVNALGGSQLFTQEVFDTVLTGGKPDAMTECLYRNPVTSYLDQKTGITYPIAGWYIGQIDSRSVVWFGLLAGHTRQLLIVDYDEQVLTRDIYSHNVVIQ